MPADDLPLGIDPSKPHIARMYDYSLGGTHNFAADREAMDALTAAIPVVAKTMRVSRAFLQRAVRYLAGEAGIRQFIDIGAGLPTMGSVHEITRQVAPTARVVYVDNDPVILAHIRAQALLDDTRHATAILEDLRRPAEILGNPELRALVDLSEPVAVLLCGILHFITDDDAYASVAYLREAIAPGSYMAISLAALTPGDHKAGDLVTAKQVYDTATSPLVLRDWPQVTQFFSGLELVDPGLVWTAQWRPGPEDVVEDPAETQHAAAVGRKH
jgi:S-adenosyl methyltransferase